MPGRIIIITTNYPQKIDKALLRPGRIDINIELKKASKTILYEIVSSFYDVEINEIINMFNNEIKDYILTPSEIKAISENKMYPLTENFKQYKFV
jgi:chaperone BCS1